MSYLEMSVMSRNSTLPIAAVTVTPGITNWSYGFQQLKYGFLRYIIFDSTTMNDFLDFGRDSSSEKSRESSSDLS